MWQKLLDRYRYRSVRKVRSETSPSLLCCFAYILAAALYKARFINEIRGLEISKLILSSPNQQDVTIKQRRLHKTTLPNRLQYVLV